jgi:hypothetical protein
MSAILVEMTRRYLGRHEIVTLPAIIDWYERHKKECQQSYPVQDLVQTFLESITHHFQQHSEHASIRFRQIF